MLITNSPCWKQENYVVIKTKTKKSVMPLYKDHAEFTVICVIVRYNYKTLLRLKITKNTF